MMIGRDLYWTFFSSLILLVTGVMGVLVLVTAVIVDLKDDHERDQSKPCTFEFFENLFYTLKATHSYHIFHMTTTLQQP